MQNSGDAPILHRLARCFGRGLAFGAGMTLTQQALRNRAASHTAPEPLAAPEPRVPVAPPPAPAERPRAAQPATRAQLDMRAIQAIVTVVGQRIEERAAQTERRLAEVEAGAGVRMQALVSRQVEGEVAGLRGQVVKTHREFAEAVARIVSEQVAREVAERTIALEAGVQQRIEAAVAPLRAELRELRQRLAETENTMHEFANAIGDTVRMAAERAAFAPRFDREAVPQRTAETQRAAAATARRPAPARAAGKPRHHDLRVLRQRLQAADCRDDFPLPGFAPLPAASAQRKASVLRPFAVAS